MKEIKITIHAWQKFPGEEEIALFIIDLKFIEGTHLDHIKISRVPFRETRLHMNSRNYY